MGVRDPYCGTRRTISSFSGTVAQDLGKSRISSFNKIIPTSLEMVLEPFLLDLQVLLVLLGLVAHLGLQAFLDLLGQKVSRVLQGLQVLTVSLAPKGLLDFLVFLENRVSLFHRCQVYQAPEEIQESPALDIQASQEPLAQQEMDQLDLVDLLAPVASMNRICRTCRPSWRRRNRTYRAYRTRWNWTNWAKF